MIQLLLATRVRTWQGQHYSHVIARIEYFWYFILEIGRFNSICATNAEDLSILPTQKIQNKYIINIKYKAWSLNIIYVNPENKTEKAVEKAAVPPLAKSSLHASMDLSCLLYTSPSPRDRQKSRMPSSA